MTLQTTGETSAQLLARAIDLFHAGKTDEGISVLEEARALDPKDLEVAGHLAWAYFSTGKPQKAAELYEMLEAANPNNPEPTFRLLQIRLKTQGYRRELLEKMLDLMERMHVDRQLWTETIHLAGEQNEKKLQRRAYRGAMRAYPNDAQLAASYKFMRRQARRRALNKLPRLLGIEKLLGMLLKINSVRSLLRRQLDGSSSFFYSSLVDFYRAGSTGVTFPAPPKALLAEQFDSHREQCACGWFHWMEANTPQKGAQGMKLVDVGCGPGHIGQHMSWLGYKITAVSGNPEELLECQKRGMTPVQCEMHSIPLPNASFDAALASHVLEHSVAPMVLLWEIARLLKPGGILYVALPLPIDGQPCDDFPESYDPKTDTYDFHPDEYGNASNPVLTYYTYGFPPHIFVLTYWQWRWVFRQAGFEHVASGVECPGGIVISPEEALRTPSRSPQHRNQLFILRRK